ncbi:MAG: helix-turn-helix domain-containing protein [Patescibacteria group bacterium]
MFKLLIADDEAGSREWLAREIRWEEHDICLVGPAADGAEAWDLFEEESPEIILTDIRMPGMDGIELARAALARTPGVRILVISGHDEFAYAKACLEIGVCGYILKPAPPEEILQAVLKERDSLLARQADERVWASFRGQLQGSIPFLREQFLRELWQGDAEGAGLADRLRFLQIPVEPDRPAVTLLAEVKDNVEFYLHHDEKERQLIWYAMFGLTEAVLGEAGCAARLERGRVGALVYGAPDYAGEGLAGLAAKLAQTLLDQARAHLPCALAIGIGGVAETIAASHRSYAQARQALLLQARYPGESLADHDSGQGQQAPFLSHVEEERLAANLETGDTGEPVRALLEYLLGGEPAGRTPACPDWRRENGLALAGAMARIARRNGLTLREALADEDYALLMRGGPDGEPAEVKRWWETQFGRLGQAISKLQSHKLRACIKKAQEYIEAHLAETISLARVARMVYMSPSYLSRLFREQTGENFSEYITRRRMAEARRLLDEGDKKVYEIAAAVGYADAAYFGRVFRQFYNVTPTDYRAGRRETT